MELKKGYKQTEVGIIPEDWEVVRASDTCSKIQDGTHFSPRPGGNDHFYITSKNIRFGYLDISTASRIDAAQHRAIYKRCDVKRGDLLFTKDGANTGNAALNTFDEEFSLLSSVAFLRFDPNKHIAAYFLQQILTSQGQRQIQDAMAGNAITRLTLEKINKLRFPLPPTKAEQEAIAAVLSNTDTLISSLEKLIAKKRNIKQGIMQELLIGKKRLPGFSGKWETKPVGQLGKPYGGLSGKSKYDFENGTYPYIPFLNIMNNPVIDTTYFDYVNIGISENQNTAMKGDLFFNGSSETPEEVGMCSVLLDDVTNLYLNSFCFGFRLNKELKTNGLYLSYFFRSNEGRKLFYTLAQGATRYNLSKHNFMKMEISYPKPEEQTAIAQVLSDMDAEIKALEQKRGKYKMIKQGMMQQLLTGRIRLL